MARFSKTMKRNPFLRSLNISIAGARTGSALMADKVINTFVPGRDSNPLLAREARKFVAELGNLKGTYVKAGQMLALVGEFVFPQELTEALHSLESATEPMGWPEVDSILHERLGAHYHELDIDPLPIGVASLAQVHRARIIATGDEICLKILYPGVKETIESDFRAVVRMLKLTSWIKLSRGFDDWLQQLREQLLLEVDYHREITMTQKAASLLGSDTRYVIPQVYPTLCSDELIAMTFLDGEPVTSGQVAELSLERRNQIAANMLELLFKEIYEWRLFQADPNFGNYRIAINEDGNDQLVLLDFGSVLDAGDAFFDALGETIFAAQACDHEAVAAGLQKLGCLQEDASEKAQQTFVNFCIEIMEPMRPESELPEAHLNADGQYCWSQSKLMKRASKIAGKSVASRSFSLPSQNFALVTRKLIGVFTFISVLQAEFNGAPLLDKYRA